MTFEDFVESVIAGWVPVAWGAVVHALAKVWAWIALQVAIAAYGRLRK